MRFGKCKDCKDYKRLVDGMSCENCLINDTIIEIIKAMIDGNIDEDKLKEKLFNGDGSINEEELSNIIDEDMGNEKKVADIPDIANESNYI